MTQCRLLLSVYETMNMQSLNALVPITYDQARPHAESKPFPDQSVRMDLVANEIFCSMYRQPDHPKVATASDFIDQRYPRAYCQVRGYLAIYMVDLEYSLLRSRVTQLVKEDLRRQELLEPLARDVLQRVMTKTVSHCLACRGVARSWKCPMSAHAEGCLADRQAAMARSFISVAMGMGIGNLDCLQRAINRL